MWNIGDKVAFFNVDETWDYVNDWKRYVEDDVNELSDDEVAGQWEYNVANPKSPRIEGEE